MRLRTVAISLTLAVLAATPVRAGHDGTRHGTRYRDAIASNNGGGAVASISDYASAVGVDVLDRGGNAADAAVATVFAVGVTRPDMGGIGGGGFLVFRGANGRTAALDFRELSPISELFDADVFSGTGMHREDDGGAGHRVIGVPGVVAGMDAALKRLGSGRFTLAELISNGCTLACTRPPYAHELARDGFQVTIDLARSFFDRNVTTQRLQYYPETRRIYSFTENPNAAYKMTFKQEDYARSLAFIAHNGPDAFYEGADFPDPDTGLPRKSIARLIAEDMAKAEEAAKTNERLQLGWPDDPDDPSDGPNDTGYLTVADFERYHAIWRTPLASTYLGHDVVTMPPPASGVAAIETLNLLEDFALASKPDLPIELDENRDSSWARSSANHLHVLAESERIAFVDRAAYIADPDYTYDYDGDGAVDPMPVDTLTSKDYADRRRAEIDLNTARLDYQPGVSPGSATSGTSTSNTNHLSVVDRDGNAVAVTTTVNGKFGSKVVAPGTGFLLNNTLTDFTWDPELGGPTPPNEPAPRKRPRSYQTPTIVTDGEGRVVVATGAAGGSMIPLGVVQMVVNTVAYGLDIAHSMDAERVQAASCLFSPAQLCIESNRHEDLRKNGDPEEPNQRVPDAVLDELESRGHAIVALPDFTTQPAEYWFLPILTAVGLHRSVGAYGAYEAISDPRSEHDDFDPTGKTFGFGAMAQCGEGTPCRREYR